MITLSITAICPNACYLSSTSYVPGTELKILDESIHLIVFMTQPVRQNPSAQHSTSHEKPTGFLFSFFDRSKCQQVQMNPVIIESIWEVGMLGQSGEDSCGILMRYLCDPA
jgi:hypothetical protein